jgi:Kef-type K+ transport system membrane component KefB
MTSIIDNFLSSLPVNLTGHVTAMVLLGIILSLSILADTIASRTRIPRISILVLLGVFIAFVHQILLKNPAGTLLNGMSEPLIQIALVMVAFLLGSELTLDRLKVTGPLIFIISAFVIVAGGIAVGAGLLALGFPLAVALALAAISVATDPAAVSETVRKTNDKRLKTKVLLGIVAIDDAWGIIVFGLSMAILGWIMADKGHMALIHAAWELGGAILLGAMIGLPGAWLTGRLQPGEPTQVEAWAIVILLAGLSSLFGVSALLASMFTGTLIANLSAHHTRSFSEIEHIEWPFLVFFFVLSGAGIDLYHLDDALWLTLAYILLRLSGRLLGGWTAVKFKRVSDGELPGDIGLALTPQAGVAIGMALLFGERFAEYQNVVLPVVVSSTVIFEMIGPLLVRRVLR